MSVDPLQDQYPDLTPYQFSSNTPIQSRDLDGRETEYYLISFDKQGKSQITLTKTEHGIFGLGFGMRSAYVTYKGKSYMDSGSELFGFPKGYINRQIDKERGQTEAELDKQFALAKDVDK